MLTGEQVLNLYPELGPQVNPETGEEESIIEKISPYSDEDFPSSQNNNQQKTWTPDVSKRFRIYI